jgi:hypothetical protein
MNTAAMTLFGVFGAVEGSSLLRLMQSAELQSHIENWGEVAHHAMLRLRTESAAQGGVAELEQAATQLSQHALPTPMPRTVVTTIYRFGQERLSLFSTIAQFGSAEAVHLHDIRVELYFPADDATRSSLVAIGSDH